MIALIHAHLEISDDCDDIRPYVDAVDMAASPEARSYAMLTLSAHLLAYAATHRRELEIVDGEIIS